MRKTKMVQFLCKLMRGNKERENMTILKVHGGITHDVIRERIDKAVRMAEENKNLDINMTIMFFDEANTTSAIGSIKEAMVDRLNSGEPIPSSSTLQFVCAVNPYRKHSQGMIDKLEEAGLGYHIKAENTRDKLGNIPLRQLVYRVHMLPVSIVPLVWDFGTISPNNERRYIGQMVSNVSTQLGMGRDTEELLTSTLQASQEFMRNQSDECSFVSLRDVERTLTALKWFYAKVSELLPFIREALDIDIKGMTNLHLSILLAFGISYHARLERERTNYAIKAIRGV